jgi:ABC-type polysaccharide transport system permease subunit
MYLPRGFARPVGHVLAGRSVIDHLGDVGGVIADPLKVLGDEQQMRRLTNVVRIFHHVRQQSAKDGVVKIVAREVFSAVPAPLKESAVALGSTRWEILSRVTLPYTRSAVIGAVFLGLGRALGETMAVTFVLGNAHDLSLSLLMPSNSIAAAIANEFTEADTELYRSSLIALGFLLFVVTFIVLTIAKLMLLRLNRQFGRTH